MKEEMTDHNIDRIPSIAKNLRSRVSTHTHTHTVDREELSVMVLVQVDICRFDLNHHFYMLEDCTVIHNRNTDYPLLNLFNINPQ